MDPAAQMMRVVRGEADWRSLKEFGFGIECEPIEGGFRWNFSGPMPATVDLTPEDIVAAVLRLRGKDEQFKEWTRFIMMASDLVGFDAIENWPHREEFINAMLAPGPIRSRLQRSIGSQRRSGMEPPSDESGEAPGDLSRAARRFRLCHPTIEAYSGTAWPDPPSSFGKSFSFGNPSFIGSTVSE